MTAIAIRLPSRTWRVLLNVAAFQAAWFACVALAARGEAGWAVVAVAAAVLLHLALSDKPLVDALLAVFAIGVGLAWDTAAIRAGWISYAAPGPVAGIAPPWILALWALFATTLREPLRWMHSRPLVAALFGAVGGPLSYAAAARMGACSFDDTRASLVVLGIAWALIAPVLVKLAQRLDGQVKVAG
ncbi:MAG TPA: DUF2878 domain-containing protein [Ramlibacter sp.]|jgi:hypothetical protein